MFNSQLLLSILGLVSGAVMLAAGGLVLYRTASFLNAAVETTAIVYADAAGAKSFHFTTDDERQVVLAALAGTTRYAEGEQVRILYDPDYPENARIKRESNWWLLPIVTAIVGLILLISGASGLARTAG